jgi:hypothetical protein
MSAENSFTDSLNQLIERAVEKALDDRLAQPPSTTPDRSRAASELPAFMTADELAELLRLGTPDRTGKRAGGVRTIREWTRTGRIPHRRAGGRVLFYLPDILEWTARGR